MSQPSTIRLERTTPRTARITFANPPVNLVVPETVVTLHEIVRGARQRPRHPGRRLRQRGPRLLLQPLRRRRGRQPARARARGRHAGLDRHGPAVEQGPVRQHRGHPGPHPRRRQRAGPRLRPAVRQPREGDLRPARGRHRHRPRRRRQPSGFPAPSAATGRSRRSSPAPTTTPTWPNAGDGSPAPCPTRNSTPSSTRRSPASPPSTGRHWRPRRRWSAGPPCRRTPTWSPPTASSRLADAARDSSPVRSALGALAADKGLDVEYQLGEYVGLVNQNL